MCIPNSVTIGMQAPVVVRCLKTPRVSRDPKIRDITQFKIIILSTIIYCILKLRHKR